MSLVLKLTKLQRTTLYVIVSDIVLLVAYDIWVAMQPDGGKSATISWMISWSFQQWWSASLILAFGILIGHFVAQDGVLGLDGKIK